MREIKKVHVIRYSHEGIPEFIKYINIYLTPLKAL